MKPKEKKSSKGTSRRSKKDNKKPEDQEGLQSEQQFDSNSKDEQSGEEQLVSVEDEKEE